MSKEFVINIEKFNEFLNKYFFCDSRNHKRRTVRIDKEDSERNIDCKWADGKAR